jgi:hypothetical protein
VLGAQQKGRADIAAACQGYGISPSGSTLESF